MFIRELQRSYRWRAKRELGLLSVEQAYTGTAERPGQTRARPLKPRFVRDPFVGSPYLGPKSAHRRNARVCKGIRRATRRSEGVGGEGRCEGAHVRVWLWGKDTRDGEAV